jgi:SAM-dependent methyltransferase
MTEDKEYILGTDPDELARLRFQHQVWVKEQYALCQQAGLRSGDTVLDLGCGPGFTSFELAHIVGPAGKVIARDRSARFLDFLRVERDHLGHAQVEPSLGSVEELDLPQGHLDAAYARWLFCWLPDPGAALKHIERSLKPGGAIILQDYIDWGAMQLMPRSEIFDSMVDACMLSWKDGGSIINIGTQLPSLAQRCGLAVEAFRPMARAGPVGSMEWRWIDEFFHGYLPRLVEQDRVSKEELDAFKGEHRRRSEEGASYCYTPTMVDVILRKR